MTFTIEVQASSRSKELKRECLVALAKFLDSKKLKFNVRCNPNEIDLDSLAKA